MPAQRSFLGLLFEAVQQAKQRHEVPGRVVARQLIQRPQASVQNLLLIRFQAGEELVPIDGVRLFC